MSLADTFFDPLDEMLGAGKIAQIRGFIKPFREQFLALENDAKTKSGKAKDKNLAEEIERLQTELEKSRAALHAAEKDCEAKCKDLEAQAERLKFEKGRFRDEVADLGKQIGELTLDIELLKETAVIKSEENASRNEKEREWPEEAVKVLEALSEYDGIPYQKLPEDRKTQLAVLAFALDMEAAAIQHCLHEMEAAGLVQAILHDDGWTIRWEIDRLGRALLFNRNRF